MPSALFYGSNWWGRRGDIHKAGFFIILVSKGKEAILWIGKK